MTAPEPARDWEPRFPVLIALITFTLAALSLCWPILSGKFVGGDDQVVAGYAFRLFASDFFKEYGAIPQWNPYIFGGMPFSAVIGHGDIFYPTAWLRWFTPVDWAMSFGFFFHIALAGAAVYAFIRALGLSWTAAVVAGVAYQLSGNVSSMLSPGHDGKLFVCALTPFAFMALLRAVRHGRWGYYGLLALVVGLAILSPQVQMAYYMMVACGLFAIWLAFFDPERRKINPWITLATALAAVVLGIGVSMIQIYPILSHVKYTPRAVSGASTGWEYATSYALPVPELITVILPQFSGMLDHYTGSNGIKTHTEYLGVLTLVLAIFGAGLAHKRKVLLPFAVIAGLFLLISFGGHTPFYRIWYEVMPMMKQVRAAGMAFFLVGFSTAVMAAYGVERIRLGEVRPARIYLWFGIAVGLGLLSAAGALEPVSEAFSHQMLRGRPGHAEDLQMGGFRLMGFAALGGALLLALTRRKLSDAMAASALILVVGADSWSILRSFANWLPPASVTYGDDQVIATLKQDTKLPFRIFDPNGAAAQAQAYGHSLLMAHRVPTLFGYHGMESVYFDSLFGGKNIWTNQLDPSLWNLYSLNYLVFNQELQEDIPGYHKVMGPVQSMVNLRPSEVVLYQRDSLLPWVRVVSRGIKVPEDQLIPTLINAGFPTDEFVLFADTAQVSGTTTSTERPGPSPIKATLTEWRPGAMKVQLQGSDSVTNWLLVAENWYPDWHATVDGSPAPAVRADYALLGVPIPPGAREISLVFDVAEYHKGKWITLISVIAALAVLAGGSLGRRRVDA